ncbi:MAG: phosphatase PAP2 family protein [Dehalococcoidia bacterium]|nr:phosphatase PAP2 family protein [Dehalococcoidia bacterium]
MSSGLTLRRRDLIRAAAALALAGLALVLYVEWYGGAPLPGDLSVTREVQSWGGLERNANAINHAADALWVIVPAVVILVAFGKRLGLRTASTPSRREALAVLAAAIVLRLGNGLLKSIVESPRPSVSLGVRVDGVFHGYGFPSGHVYSDTLLYGVIAAIAPAWLPRPLVLPARVICLAIIVLAGPARISVGAHWPSDTLGGYLLGGAAACLALWFGRYVARRR